MQTLCWPYARTSILRVGKDSTAKPSMRTLCWPYATTYILRVGKDSTASPLTSFAVASIFAITMLSYDSYLGIKGGGVDQIKGILSVCPYAR